MAVIRVTNQGELNTAMMNVQSGDKIVLASGNYSELKIVSNWQKDFMFTGKVTITSEDKSNPAVVNQMFLRNASNLDINNIAFTHNGVNASGTESFRSSAPFYIEKVTNLRIDDSVFTGNKVDGFGTKVGLRMKDSSAVTIVDSRFVDFNNGMNIANSADLNISRNVIRGIANDGMTFGAIENMLLSYNKFRAYSSPQPDSLHKDNIQFRIDTGEPASKNIIIRANDMDSAEVRHGIYFGNELAKVGVTQNATYENILIEANLIRSAQVHGITMFEGNGVYIRNNTIEQNGDLGFNYHARMVPIINVSKWSDNVVITGNDVVSVPVAQNPSWTVSGNNTGQRQLPHWDGTEYSGYTAENYGAVLDAPGAPPTFSNLPRPPRKDMPSVINVTVPASADQFSFDSVLLDGGTRAVISGLDIPGGDDLLLVSFDEGTFVNRADGNFFSTWDNGRGARFDSLVDFHEAHASSPATFVRTEGADLVLEIAVFRGVAEIVLVGMAEAYAEAYPPNWV